VNQGFAFFADLYLDRTLAAFNIITFEGYSQELVQLLQKFSPGIVFGNVFVRFKVRKLKIPDSSAEVFRVKDVILE
jgi:hypothetical protein